VHHDHPAAVERHLEAWLGAWPPTRDRLEAVGHPARAEPGWDGGHHPLIGIIAPDGGILSLRPDLVERVRPLLTSPEEAADPRWRARVADAIGLHDQVIGNDVFRFVREAPSPDALPDVGRWVPAGDPDLPDWLRPFNAPEALVAREHDQLLGAAGIKMLSPHGAEIAVVIEPNARGRGLARSLTAQACRRLIADGLAPTVIHADDNIGSVRAAEAVGFTDEGWRALEVLPREARWRGIARRARRRVRARRDRGGRPASR